MKIILITICFVVTALIAMGATESNPKREALWTALKAESAASKWKVDYTKIDNYVECINLDHIYFIIDDQPYTYGLGSPITKSRLKKEGINRITAKEGKWGEYVILWSNGQQVTSIQAWSCTHEKNLISQSTQCR